jgi:hypothetical protein
VEYIILEGSAVFVTLTILRDVSIFDGLVVLEYATSDLTAKGIDEAKHKACMLMATADRGIQGYIYPIAIYYTILNNTFVACAQNAEITCRPLGWFESCRATFPVDLK